MDRVARMETNIELYRNDMISRVNQLSSTRDMQTVIRELVNRTNQNADNFSRLLVQLDLFAKSVASTEQIKPILHSIEELQVESQKQLRVSVQSAAAQEASIERQDAFANSMATTEQISYLHEVTASLRKELTTLNDDLGKLSIDLQSVGSSQPSASPEIQAELLKLSRSMSQAEENSKMISEFVKKQIKDVQDSQQDFEVRLIRMDSAFRDFADRTNQRHRSLEQADKDIRTRQDQQSATVTKFGKDTTDVVSMQCILNTEVKNLTSAVTTLGSNVSCLATSVRSQQTEVDLLSTTVRSQRSSLNSVRLAIAENLYSTEAQTEESTRVPCEHVESTNVPTARWSSIRQDARTIVERRKWIIGFLLLLITAGTGNILMFHTLDSGARSNLNPSQNPIDPELVTDRSFIPDAAPPSSKRISTLYFQCKRHDDGWACKHRVREEIRLQWHTS